MKNNRAISLCLIRPCAEWRRVVLWRTERWTFHLIWLTRHVHDTTCNNQFVFFQFVFNTIPVTGTAGVYYSSLHWILYCVRVCVMTEIITIVLGEGWALPINHYGRVAPSVVEHTYVFISIGRAPANDRRAVGRSTSPFPAGRCPAVIIYTPRYYYYYYQVLL